MKTTPGIQSPSKLSHAPAQPQFQPVHFALTNPSARKVCIAGSVHDWQPDPTELTSMGNGRWLKDLNLPPGTYEYRFVVDGTWITDPKSSRTAPNPFGGTNSLLTVPSQQPSPQRASNRHSA